MGRMLAVLSSTPFVSGTFTPTWASGGCVVKASDLLSSGFKIGVYDDDISDDDVIASAGLIAVTESALLAGRIDGINNGSTLTTLSVVLQRL